MGAGTGALVAGLKGGIGSASAVLPDGATVAALVVVNAIGTPLDLRTGELLGARHLLIGDASGLRAPSAPELAALSQPGRPREPRLVVPEAAVVQNTTIGVIATDSALTKAQCTKLAGIGHDGLARAIDPVHTMFDGDTLFGLSTAARPAPGPFEFHQLLCTAAAVVTRAVMRAVLAARQISTPGGTWSGYLDLAPSAVDGHR